MKLNPTKIRRDFPILSQKSHGHALVYLDSTSTSQKPTEVIEATNKFYKTYNANIHRGIYQISEKATEAYEDARKTIAQFINASSQEEIIFTRNATEAINLVAYSWASSYIKKGDAILITEMEHHSNLVPWQQLALKNQAKLRFIPITKEGELDLTQLDNLLKGVKLVAITQMSNVLGTINPVREIIKKAHAVGSKVLVDGAQSVAHMPVDVQNLDCDFLVFSGHKMCGPTGIGVLYGKRAILNEMPPFLYGGDMIKAVFKHETIFNDLPYKFEAGTPNIAGAIGLGAAIKYLNKIGLSEIHKYETDLVKHALQKLATIPGITIYGPKNASQRGGSVSFNIKGIHPHDLATALDEKGICIRSGNHCAMPLHDILKESASARASFYFYNTRQEVDYLVKETLKLQTLLAKAYKKLKK